VPQAAEARLKAADGNDRRCTQVAGARLAADIGKQENDARMKQLAWTTWAPAALAAA